MQARRVLTKRVVGELWKRFANIRAQPPTDVLTISQTF